MSRKPKAPAPKEPGALFNVRITNLIDRSIGTEGGLLAPGESVVLELTADELDIWEACEHAEVHNLGRSESGGDTPATEGPDDT
jgi:hypothetical protein